MGYVRSSEEKTIAPGGRAPGAWGVAIDNTIPARVAVGTPKTACRPATA
jgi:hypothetical protein